MEKGEYSLMHKGLNPEQIRDLDYLLDRSLLYDVVAPKLAQVLRRESSDQDLDPEKVRAHFILLAFRVAELEAKSGLFDNEAKQHMIDSLQNAFKLAGSSQVVDQEMIEIIAPRRVASSIAANVTQAELRYDGQIDTNRISFMYVDAMSSIPDETWARVA